MYVLYGRPDGWPDVIDLSEENLPGSSVIRIALIEGANGSVLFDLGDIICYSAASGDIDRDGHTDIIVNEMVDKS